MLSLFNGVKVLVFIHVSIVALSEKKKALRVVVLMIAKRSPTSRRAVTALGHDQREILWATTRTPASARNNKPKAARSPGFLSRA